MLLILYLMYIEKKIMVPTLSSKQDENTEENYGVTALLNQWVYGNFQLCTIEV